MFQGKQEQASIACGCLISLLLWTINTRSASPTYSSYSNPTYSGLQPYSYVRNLFSCSVEESLTSYFHKEGTLGRVPLPNRIILQFFYDRYDCIYASIISAIISPRIYICEEMWWLYSMKCMHMISMYRCNTIVIQYNCWKKNIPWTLKLLFCINFMIKKLCLKFPKSAI